MAESIVDATAVDATALRSELAASIVNARRRLGLTQSELAELAGTSVGQVLRIEDGTSPAYLDRLVSLLDSCGLELRVERRSDRATIDEAP